MNLDMTNLIRVYGMAAAVLLVMDLLWLGVAAKGFYARHLGALLRDQVVWPAALLFYAVYVGGIMVFVVVPALRDGTGVLQTALLGAALGLFAYGTFDLTALALFRHWSVTISVVDILWGVVLTSTTTTLTVWLARVLLKPT